MIVASFWAQARIQHRIGRKTITVKRYGWSDQSEEDAQKMANQRAEAALESIISGKEMKRIERGGGYNGAEGIPIREEIVERFGETVITRNGYGALCLNTPKVLFADVDTKEPACMSRIPLRALIIGIGVLIGLVMKSPMIVLFSVLVAFVAPLIFGKASGCPAVRDNRDLGEKEVIEAISLFISRHPEWNLRLYRTPGGFRMLVMHAVFDPAEPIVEEFFNAVGADPVYVSMCKRQNCFRARVSPKPWRIGIFSHIKPSRGSWPIRPEHLATRAKWIENYERAARDYSSCCFVKSFGSGLVEPNSEKVMQIHDSLSGADKGLPIA